MKRARGRHPTTSFAILFLCTFAAYLVVPPLMRLVWPDENPKPFLDDVLHQFPVGIVVGLVVAIVTLIERRDQG